MAIRLRVKSEGMSNTLFTMELTSNSFTKMSDFEVYRLPYIHKITQNYTIQGLYQFWIIVLESGVLEIMTKSIQFKIKLYVTIWESIGSRQIWQ